MFFFTLSAISTPRRRHVSQNCRSNHLEILFALVLGVEGYIIFVIAVHDEFWTR